MYYKIVVLTVVLCGVLSQNAKAQSFGKKRSCAAPLVCNPCQPSTSVQVIHGPIVYTPKTFCSPVCKTTCKAVCENNTCTAPCVTACGGSGLGVDEFGDTITAILSERVVTGGSGTPVSGDPDDLLKIEELLIELLKNRNEKNVSEAEARQLIESFREQLP